MPLVQASTLVNASAQRLFDILTDVPAAPSWLSGVSQASFVTSGAPAVGTKFTQVRKTMGRASRVDGTFVDCQPPQRLVLDIHRDGKPAGIVTWTLAAEGSATRVTSTIDFRLPGLMKIMTPVVKGVVAKQNEEDLASLKRKAEG